MHAPTKNKMDRPQTLLTYENERGVFLIYFSLLIVALLSIGSFAVDLGFGYSEMRRIHIATDNAALGAMYYLESESSARNDDAKKNAVIGIANSIVTANGVLQSELSAGTGTGIQLGRWDDTQKTFTPENDIAAVDAIRVGARRTIPTMLAVLFGHETISPMVSSIARVGSPTSDICLVPYGILDDLVDNLTPGDILTVDRNTTSAGNWGKLNIDPDGNMSSRNEFIPAFLSGICNTPVNVGQFIPSAPGFAGLEDAVDQRQTINPVVKLALVADFFNGKKPVEIVGFATVKIVAQRRQGRNWEADFLFLKRASGNGTTGPGGGVRNRSVVLVR